MVKKTILFIPLFLFAILAGSQIRSRGIPFICNYTTKDYKGAPQNWASIQDKRGVQFFGNNDGVIEFDGTYWNTLKIPNKTGVRSFAMDAKGTVYVGAQGDFGYLASDSLGTLKYISILPQGFAKKHQVGDIWRIFASGEGIVFQDLKNIFLYKNNKIEIIASGVFDFASQVNNTWILPVHGKGLFQLDKGQLKFLPGSNTAKTTDCAFILPFSPDTLLIGTYAHGLFLYTKATIFPWNVPANVYLVSNGPYSAAVLFNGNAFAFGTSHDGLVISDKKGNLIQHINKSMGLANATVLSIQPDRQGNLWLGLGNGIAYLETNSPFSFSPTDIGLGYASSIYKGRLYLGTNEGLLSRPWASSPNQVQAENAFQGVPGTGGQIWNLSIIDKQLFIGKHDGALALSEAGLLSTLTTTPGVWNFTRLNAHPNYILSGTYNGLILFEKKNGTWKFKHKIKGFEESSRFVELDKDGYLWISHGYKGVFRLRLNANTDSVAEVRFYNHANGFPSDIQINVFKIQGTLIFAAEKGIYVYDKLSDRFVPDAYYTKLFGPENHIGKIAEDAAGNLWYCRDGELGLLLKTTKGYQAEKRRFNKLAGTLLQGFENIYPVQNSDVIIATQNGVVYYNPRLVVQNNIPFKTLIRKVQKNSESPKRVFGGYNAFRFFYAATFYEDKSQSLYQHYLKGFDRDWSAWSPQTEKEYTNLPEGTYTFFVRAKNVFGTLGSTDSYTFKIQPPWYRHPLAYILYSIAFFFFVFSLIRFYNNKLEKKNKQLILEQERALELLAIQHAQTTLKAEKELISLKNESLRNEVAFNNKELTATTMYILHKNEALKKIKDVLLKVLSETNELAQTDLKMLIDTLNRDMDIDKNWQQFEIHFDQIHDQFLQRLRSRFPNLSPTDLKLCAYLRINLTTKDIAPLLNISIRGVEIARYRLRKKLNLTPDQNLLEFILNI